MQKWNQVNKRLKTLIADGLDIAFNHSPVVKKTYGMKAYFTPAYSINFFHIKFNGKIIWEYPKDNAYHNFRFIDEYIKYDNWHRPWQGGEPERNPHSHDFQFASPENIIAGYLDMPKDKLLEFDEPTGIRYILWACDKRIGKQKLSQMKFIQQAQDIIKARFPNYNLEPCLGNSMTLVYSDKDISIFGKSKWKFHSTFSDDYYDAHRFIVTDNPSYSLSKHATELDFDGKITKGNGCTVYPKMFSKKVLQITPDIEERIISALKSPSQNMPDKTVWEELIILENLYPTTKNKLDENLQIFEKIKNPKNNLI